MILERRLKRRTLATPLIFHRTSKRREGQLTRRRPGQPIGRIDSIWRAACAAAGLKAGRLVEGGVTPYDLRRTALRNIVRATGSERAAMAYSGHKTRATFDRYNIHSDSDQRETMAATERYVLALPTKRKVARLRPSHRQK